MLLAERRVALVVEAAVRQLERSKKLPYTGVVPGQHGEDSRELRPARAALLNRTELLRVRVRHPIAHDNRLHPLLFD